ncbi:MAG: hypothetical protein CXZ00_13500 [Acidobacteria bacterium]|nr:MAG: hypothetical protein CXZ00_13500 [Acidobacteriota bacterium]
MRLRLASSILVCPLLLASAAEASVVAESRQAAALWLSRQLHRPVEASQVLVSPRAATLEGCTITNIRPAPTGATALSLRCPDHALPQLVLLGFPVSNAASHTSISSRLSHKAPPIVRAGATLRADWRTDSMHAQLDVVAMDSGAAGAEIRVRIAHSNRIMRARVLSAHTVGIVAAGAGS